MVRRSFFKMQTQTENKMKITLTQNKIVEMNLKQLAAHIGAEIEMEPSAIYPRERGVDAEIDFGKITVQVGRQYFIVNKFCIDDGAFIHKPVRQKIDDVISDIREFIN